MAVGKETGNRGGQRQHYDAWYVTAIDGEKAHLV